MSIFFSGNACRHQVNSYLQKYKTLEEAEEDLQINCFSGGIQECSSEEASSPVVTSTPQSLQDKNTSFSPVLAFSPHSTNSFGDTGVQVSLGDSIAKVVKLLAMMSSRMSQGLLQSLVYQYMFLEFNKDLLPYVPSDFIVLCCKGISVIHQNEKDNIIYYLVKGLGIPREDCTGPRLPIDSHLDYLVITFAILL